MTVRIVQPQPQGIEIGINHQLADGVAGTGRAEYRQDKVETFTHAVNGKGLAEILTMALYPQFRCCYIGKADDADGGVDNGPAEGRQRPFELSLQKIVGENDRRREVVEEIGYSLTDRQVDVCIIELGDGAQEHILETLVELKDPPVQGLQGIVDGFFAAGLGQGDMDGIRFLHAGGKGNFRHRQPEGQNRHQEGDRPSDGF